MQIVTKKTLLRVTVALSLTFVLVLLAGNQVYAQRTVNVSPGVGTLNTAIDSDTTETGARVDSSTVYVLEKGGYYLLTGSIEHRGYHLSIVAGEGDGERPKLVPAVADGGESSRPFRPRGDLTLKGLYFTGEDELGGLTTRMVRVSENDVTIRIDDCFMEKDGQAGFRIDGTGTRIFLTNSIVANVGITSSPDNGRVLDDRGNQIDTLWFENNTFYNITAQIIRDAGGLINYANFSQNTVVNVGRGTTVEFGPVLEGVMENNLIIDASIYGYRESADTEYIVDVDSLTQTEVDSLGAQSFRASHNNIFTSAAILEAQPDTIMQAVLFTPTVEAFVNEQGSEASFISEDVTFTNGPASAATVVTEFYAGAAGTTEFDTNGEPFDFGYSSSFTSYGAGKWGQALGSIVWHPGMVVGIEDEVISESPDGFQLNGNYPNPFNPSTNISINLPSAASVVVEVFNTVGQKVMTLPAQQMAAGLNQSLRIDAAGLTSGMYIYRVTAVSGARLMTSTGKMTLIK